MTLNYKFRLYPTREQELVLEQTLDGCRWVYNYFLSIPPMSEYDMNYSLTDLKEQHPWLQNHHGKMLQMVGKLYDGDDMQITGRRERRNSGRKPVREDGALQGLVVHEASWMTRHTQVIYLPFCLLSCFN